MSGQRPWRLRFDLVNGNEELVPVDSQERGREMLKQFADAMSKQPLIVLDANRFVSSAHIVSITLEELRGAGWQASTVAG